MKKLYTYLEDIISIWRTFQSIWKGLKDHWKGSGRDIFENEYLEEITTATNSYIVSLKKLNEEVENIMREIPKSE